MYIIGKRNYWKAELRQADSPVKVGRDKRRKKIEDSVNTTNGCDRAG